MPFRLEKQSRKISSDSPFRQDNLIILPIAMGQKGSDLDAKEAEDEGDDGKDDDGGQGEAVEEGE